MNNSNIFKDSEVGYKCISIFGGGNYEILLCL